MTTMINKITIIKTPVKKENNKLVNYDNNDVGVVIPNEISELQGSLQELNNDKIDLINRTSGIDLRTRLYPSEISSIVIIDTLVAFKFLPITITPFTLQKKRLAVSLKGKGRNEIVDIVQGKRENDLQRGSMASKISGLFNKGDNID